MRLSLIYAVELLQKRQEQRQENNNNKKKTKQTKKQTLLDNVSLVFQQECIQAVGFIFIHHF